MFHDKFLQLVLWGDPSYNLRGKDAETIQRRGGFPFESNSGLHDSRPHLCRGNSDCILRHKLLRSKNFVGHGATWCRSFTDFGRDSHFARARHDDLFGDLRCLIGILANARLSRLAIHTRGYCGSSVRLLHDIIVYLHTVDCYDIRLSNKVFNGYQW
jgi:hypothetical protein